MEWVLFWGLFGILILLTVTDLVYLRMPRRQDRFILRVQFGRPILRELFYAVAAIASSIAFAWFNGWPFVFLGVLFAASLIITPDATLRVWPDRLFLQTQARHGRGQYRFIQVREIQRVTLVHWSTRPSLGQRLLDIKELNAGRGQLGVRIDQVDGPSWLVWTEKAAQLAEAIERIRTPPGTATKTSSAQAAPSPAQRSLPPRPMSATQRPR